MIIPERPAITLTGYDPAKRGCTAAGCNTQDTATTDGIHGRRCEAHAPVFDASRAVELMLTDPAAASGYVRGVGA